MNTGDDADGSPAPADTAPPPGLAQVEDLVGRVCASGLPVTGTRRDVPAGIDLAAYRVVQEALTNIMKQATGATAAVTITYEKADLGIEITNTAGTPSARATTGNGHGLRERLDLYGATLRNGPTPDSGYRVAALIPPLSAVETTRPTALCEW